MAARLYIYVTQRGTVGLDRLTPREAARCARACRVDPASAREYGRLCAPTAHHPTQGAGDYECGSCPLSGACCQALGEDGPCPAGWEGA